MAQPNTQDTQKVFHSATENFKSFVGSVENVSNTKHMQDIYANMTKLFDAFTNGALLEQGANSETLLRTVYRSLDEDFLQVVQDTEAVDKLIEVIKSKQEGIEPEKVEEAMVSETTKKVVTKTLNPETCDPMQVVLDFIDELQTSILQVRLNLSREYERRRLEYAKSLAGQQEDLDRLKGESEEQVKQISETLEQVSTDETTWKDAQLKELSRLVEKFDQATSKASDNILAQTLQEDKTLVEMSKEQKKVNWDKLISGIQGHQTKLLKQAQTKPSAQPQSQQTQETAQGHTQLAPESEKPQPEGQKPKQEKTPEQKPVQQPRKPEVEPPKDDLSAEAAEMEQIGKDVSKVREQPEVPKLKDSKLNVSPSKNGMCTCPICGHVHPKGTPHTPSPSPEPVKTGLLGSSKVDKQGVVNTIGKVHENIQKRLNNSKFRNAFMLDYTKIQSGLNKQMKKVDKSEATISKDLEKTKGNIKSLKKEAAASKGKGLLGAMLGGPLGIIAFTIVGGLILVTLARMAMSKWAATYMPKGDGSKMSIFGFEIPGWDAIKSFGIGIWNWVTVGLPNWWDRLKGFMSDIKKTLFGKKGMFKDAIETKYALIKIFAALLIANTQKVGGLFVKLLFKALSFIPFVGPVFGFLAEFGPMIYTFIATQLMLIFTGKSASVEQEKKLILMNQQATGRGFAKKMRTELIANAKKIQPFKGQLNVIKGLQTSKRGRSATELPSKGAIMRSVPVHYNKNFETAEKMHKAKAKSEKSAVTDEIESRLENKSPGDYLVTLQDASGKYVDWMNKFAKKDSSKKWLPGERDQMIAKGKALKRKLNATVMPQIELLNQYIKKLMNSTRFKNVKGPLYDLDKGWNPGYRVLASDLMSIIPLTPFEAIHTTADVPFGHPADAEADSIGYMPFTWYQDGAKISVHPIVYEAHRAFAIRKIYEEYLKGWENVGFWGGVGSAKPPDPKKYAKYWTEWNHAVISHSWHEYTKPENALYKNKFGRFLERLRAGNLKEHDNTLQGAKELSNSYSAKSDLKLEKEEGYISTKAARWAVEENYDRLQSGRHHEFAENSSLGFWENRRRKGERKKRAKEAQKMLKDWSNKEFFGIKYGAIRDFWMESGAIDLFRGSSIYGTTKVATPLIEFLVKSKILNKAPGAQNALQHLMHWFYKFHGITGFSWSQVMGDERDQAGFAQVFLEYLKYKVLPQWNVVERLLGDDLTYRSDETKQKMLKGVELLSKLMNQKSLFEFMNDHLRFPNMVIRIIDYSNAKGARQIKTLDKYREEMGIPDANGKDKILKEWQGIWGKIGDMTDEELDASINKLRGLMAKAEFEARYTGNYAYLKQLTQYWEKLDKEKQARLDSQLAGNKIVKKPGALPTQVLEPPPKTMTEIEEEKKKAAAEEERRKAEEERKAREEREKKLKEEAERQKQLKIAEAIIKEKEAIRKQEENYEAILQKMIGDPSKVTEKDLKSLGKEVDNLKQEAENQIAKLPREERELKLALIRGDKISEKTFTEIKETAVGLHGNLQEYINEVNQIPVGSVLAIQNTPSMNAPQPVRMQDSDSVDLGDM